MYPVRCHTTLLGSWLQPGKRKYTIPLYDISRIYNITVYCSFKTEKNQIEKYNIRKTNWRTMYVWILGNRKRNVLLFSLSVLLLFLCFCPAGLSLVLKAARAHTRTTCLANRLQKPRGNELLSAARCTIVQWEEQDLLFATMSLYF